MAGVLVADAIRTGGGITILRAIQEVRTQSSALVTTTTIIPLDNTIPQITEGVEALTVTITPTNINSLLEIEAVVQVAVASSTNVCYAFFRDATANALAANFISVDSTGPRSMFVFKHTITAGSLAATTLRLRIGPSTAVTTQMNSDGASGAYFGGVIQSRMSVTELLQGP